MWIECHEVCDACGSEVTLVTNGREAYGYDSSGPNKAVCGDTDVVWREGQLLVLQCPTWTLAEGLCGNLVSFTGEGNSVEHADPYYAKPILEEAP
jgi:hypothetical protein